jgi:hypothetical protein
VPLVSGLRFDGIIDHAGKPACGPAFLAHLDAACR